MKTDACQSNIEHLRKCTIAICQSALIDKVRVEKLCFF